VPPERRSINRAITDRIDEITGYGITDDKRRLRYYNDLIDREVALR